MEELAGSRDGKGDAGTSGWGGRMDERTGEGWVGRWVERWVGRKEGWMKRWIKRRVTVGG